MRKLPRFEAKVPRFSPKPPRPVRNCRARPLTTLSTLTTLPTRRARKPPRAAPRPVIVRGRVPKCPPNAGHDSRARFGRPKASSLIPLGARIAGAIAEAARCGIMRRFTGRSCAASSLSLDKGATPAEGGKPSAAVFRQACLVGKVPRSVLGGFAARVAPDLAESPLFGRSRETRFD